MWAGEQAPGGRGEWDPVPDGTFSAEATQDDVTVSVHDFGHTFHDQISAPLEWTA